MTAFRTTPPAAGEQLAFPLDGTLAGRYRVWRQTPEGMRVFLEIERRVLAQANNGVRRIEVNAVVATVRREWKVGIDNSARSYIARELIARRSYLKDLIEIRRQRAG